MDIITKEIEVNAKFGEKDLRALYTVLNLALSGGVELRDEDRERLIYIYRRNVSIRRLNIESLFKIIQGISFLMIIGRVLMIGYVLIKFD